MDLSLLDENTEIRSKNLLKFLTKSNIHMICERYASYRAHRNTISMKDSIQNMKEILDQLEEKGYVYSYIDASNNWNSYHLTDKGYSLIEQESKSIRPIKKEQTSHLEDLYLVATKYKNIIKSALDRNLNFDLDLDDVKNLLNEKKCFYTGKPFSSEDPLTFDRIDASKGYVKGNVVACTSSANNLKSILLEQDNSLFTNISDLKKFVDNIYVAKSTNKDPLAELIIQGD